MWGPSNNFLSTFFAPTDQSRWTSPLRLLSKLGMLYRRRRKSAMQSQPFSLNGGNVVVVEVVDVDVVVVDGGGVGGALIILATLTLVGLTCMLT